MFGQEKIMTIEHEILMENHENLMKDYESLQETIKHAEESHEAIKLHLQNKAKELEEGNKRLLEECEKERSEKEKYKKMFEEMKKTMESERNATVDELMTKSQELALAKRKEEEVVEKLENKCAELAEKLGVVEDSEDETTAIQPLQMYFQPTEYKKKIKISTRCYIHEFLTTLENLDPPLTSVERKWFEEHPQFKHMFHMPRDKNHKLMGMWMLLLRTACIEKKKEAWFVVNGVPIRYGLTEHALISGLDCCHYPKDYKKAGSLNFVKKHFTRSPIRHQDVKEKLEEMKPTENSRERLKMAVLYFLSSIIIGQTKTGADATPVESFFLRAVDDLKFCKNFPWGRLSFDHMLGEIKHMMNHFGGVVKDNVSWSIPGFCIPMELLAFEAIPELGNKFRECILGADKNCPRMCKTRFKKSEMKGFPLSKINEELGIVKDIDSILVARGEEDSYG